MIALCYEKMILGGSETLLIRIAKGLKKRNISCTVFARYICDECRKELVDNNFKFIENKNILESIIDNTDENDIVLCLDSRQFYELFAMLKKKHEYRTVYLYIVHKYHLVLKSKTRLVEKILSPFYKKMILNFYNNGNIFFMDETCVQYTEDWMGKRFVDRNKDVVLLPMEIDDLDLNIITQRETRRHEEFTILTVARADFPFKGYIKGLVEMVPKLKQKYPQVKLVIISKGEQYDEIVGWIDENGCRDYVELINGIQPSELHKYYENASLYVGMGTTIMEAASFGLPVIPIRSYTYEAVGVGYFHDRPKRLGAESADNPRGIDELVERVIISDENEYIKLSNESRKALEENYSMNGFIDFILNRKLSGYKNFIYRGYNLEQWLRDVKNIIVYHNKEGKR